MESNLKAPSRAKAALKAAACVLFAVHMAATCAQQVPAQSALHPLSEPFVPYEELTGIWQSWDMFTTIPYLHGYDVELDVTDADGQTRLTGLTLPGFLPYDHSVRNETFFIRVIGDKDYTQYLGGYVDNLCAALRSATGRGGQKLVFHETYERLHWLQEIQNNGVISIHEDHPSRTFTCEG